MLVYFWIVELRRDLFSFSLCPGWMSSLASLMKFRGQGTWCCLPCQVRSLFRFFFFAKTCGFRFSFFTSCTIRQHSFMPLFVVFSSCWIEMPGKFFGGLQPPRVLRGECDFGIWNFYLDQTNFVNVQQTCQPIIVIIVKLITFNTINITES